MIKLSKHFTVEELSCKCGCGYTIFNPYMIGLLEAIRVKIGKPVNVTSGARCKYRNALCGGVENSFHMYGLAADIWVQGVPLNDIADIAKKAGASGVGVYLKQGFVHVDVRGLVGVNAARWEE